MPDRPKLETLAIVHYPDPVLRRRAEPIREIDGFLKELAERMNALMIEAVGIGLAANQIGWSHRFFIINLTGEAGRYEAFCDPEIILQEGRAREREGCLSVPGVNAQVTRPAHVIVEATRLDGERVRLDAEGYAARALLHEIDHLNGDLFIDKVGMAARIMVRSRLRELEERFKPASGTL